MPDLCLFKRTGAAPTRLWKDWDSLAWYISETDKSWGKGYFWNIYTKAWEIQHMDSAQDIFRKPICVGVKKRMQCCCKSLIDASAMWGHNRRVGHILFFFFFIFRIVFTDFWWWQMLINCELVWNSWECFHHLWVGDLSCVSAKTFSCTRSSCFSALHKLSPDWFWQTMQRHAGFAML